MFENFLSLISACKRLLLSTGLPTAYAQLDLYSSQSDESEFAFAISVADQDSGIIQSTRMISTTSRIGCTPRSGPPRNVEVTCSSVFGGSIGSDAAAATLPPEWCARIHPAM